MIDEHGNYSQQPPCFYFKTMPEALEEAGISWRYYAEGGGFLSVMGNIRHSAMWAENMMAPAQFIADAKGGHLPAVSWLLPPGEYSEHPPGSMCEGENWTVSVLNAVMQGPDWDSTAVFVTWDDFGGFYDHVAPRKSISLAWGRVCRCSSFLPMRKQGTFRTLCTTTPQYSSSLRRVTTCNHSPHATLLPAICWTASILAARHDLRYCCNLALARKRIPIHLSGARCKKRRHSFSVAVVGIARSELDGSRVEKNRKTL